MMRYRLACGMLAAMLPAVVVAQQTTPMVDGYYNIGNVHLQVSTDSKEAQKWFDRGLAMCYGFNHEEAVRCFDKATAADPKLAIAYCGKAYALGPNFNNMEIPVDQMLLALKTSDKANSLAEHASPKERAIIRAMAKRFGPDIPEDFDLREPYNRAYAEAMREVYADYPDCPAVAELFAQALMTLQPWMHWLHDGTAGKYTAEIAGMIEKALAAHPNHSGLCHLYIHLMEASPHPEKALPMANRLRGAVPGSGHLVHMPSHIDIRLGNYERVIETNREAIEVDKLFLQREGPVNFYTLYRIHNLHFLCYGAMFDGQSQVALDAARQINKEVPEAMLKEQVDFLDAFMPTALHVLIRFGKWEAILAEPEPAEYLPMSRAVRLYARTLAFAATNRVAQAEAEHAKFADAMKLVPDTSYLFQNKSQDILKVAEAMLAGEVAYRKGQYQVAFDHLREAVRRDDGLNYDEPWGWMQPARHALGALLAEQGHFAQSEAVYREDLKRHPHNPWALHGLAESLKQQGRAEAAACAREFAEACKRSDVSIDRSCFCRLRVEPVESRKE